MKIKGIHIILLLGALLIAVSGCTSHQQPANSNAGNNSPAAEAVNNNTAQLPSEKPVQNNTQAAAEAPSISTGIISSASLKYVSSANMYEGSLDFILESGQRYSISNVCVAANNFDIGQCYSINIANVDNIRAQESTSAMLKGCYIPDFSSATLQKVNCPAALS